MESFSRWDGQGTQVVAPPGRVGNEQIPRRARHPSRGGKREGGGKDISGEGKGSQTTMKPGRWGGDYEQQKSMDHIQSGGIIHDVPGDYQWIKGGKKATKGNFNSWRGWFVHAFAFHEGSARIRREIDCAMTIGSKFGGGAGEIFWSQKKRPSSTKRENIYGGWVRRRSSPALDPERWSRQGHEKSERSSNA